MPREAVRETSVSGLPLVARGKVRDIYDLGDRLLIVATDRISCFDVVLPTPIPGKGRVLTQMSLFWFEKLKSVIPNHFVSADVPDVVTDPEERETLSGRSMIVKKASPLPIEAVVRGYLSGSAWREYCDSGRACGIDLPAGLRESDRLDRPVFTPATKAEQGLHDENISFARMAEIVGRAAATRAMNASIALYNEAARHAAAQGIIIADTKFEFGLVDDEVALIDEVLTPDSSRFWPADRYAPGGPQPSFDKQYVRDFLVTMAWDKKPPAPELPPWVVEKTVEKYSEALRRLTGREA
jgi:phosphoribosylaminoimidazole-succinocarboxamide synthase